MRLIIVDGWIKKPVFDSAGVFPVIDQHGDIVIFLFIGPLSGDNFGACWNSGANPLEQRLGDCFHGETLPTGKPSVWATRSKISLAVANPAVLSWGVKRSPL
jgi:hypothetical protein